MTVHVDPARLAESSGDERRAMLEHLRGCAACRKSVAAHDPSALFALLALASIPAKAMDDVSAAVARRIDSDRTSFGFIAGTVSWPRRVAAAAVFALTLLCGYATLRAPQETAPPISRSASPRADVDVESSRGVSQVIDLTVGETQIVMVYNGELKL